MICAQSMQEARLMQGTTRNTNITIDLYDFNIRPAEKLYSPQDKIPAKTGKEEGDSHEP